MNELRISEVVADGRRRVIALEALVIDRYRAGGLCGLQARLECRAVIVLENGAARAYGADGGELPLASLVREVPGLAVPLAAHYSDHDGLRT